MVNNKGHRAKDNGDDAGIELKESALATHYLPSSLLPELSYTKQIVGSNAAHVGKRGPVLAICASEGFGLQALN